MRKIGIKILTYISVNIFNAKNVLILIYVYGILHFGVEFKLFK